MVTDGNARKVGEGCSPTFCSASPIILTSNILIGTSQFHSMDTRAITAVIRDSVIAIDIGGTMSEVKEKLNRLHDDILASVGNDELEASPDEECTRCRCCSRLEKWLLEAVESCDMAWFRDFVQEIIGCIHKQCWGRRERSSTPSTPRAEPPTPPKEEPVAGPSRAGETPSLRFKTRTRSFRNVLYWISYGNIFFYSYKTFSLPFVF